MGPVTMLGLAAIGGLAVGNVSSKGGDTYITKNYTYNTVVNNTVVNNNTAIIGTEDNNKQRKLIRRKTMTIEEKKALYIEASNSEEKNIEYDIMPLMIQQGRLEEIEAEGNKIINMTFYNKEIEEGGTLIRLLTMEFYDKDRDKVICTQYITDMGLIIKHEILSMYSTTITLQDIKITDEEEEARFKEILAKVLVDANTDDNLERVLVTDLNDSNNATLNYYYSRLLKETSDNMFSILGIEE